MEAVKRVKKEQRPHTFIKIFSGVPELFEFRHLGE